MRCVSLFVRETTDFNRSSGAFNETEKESGRAQLSLAIIYRRESAHTPELNEIFAKLNALFLWGSLSLVARGSRNVILYLITETERKPSVSFLNQHRGEKKMLFNCIWLCFH